MKRVRPQNESYSITRSAAVVERRPATDGFYLYGTVRTINGIVEVYTDHVPGRPFTCLTFVRDCRQYRRSWRGRSFTPRGLAIVAGRFAAEIASR